MYALIRALPTIITILTIVLALGGTIVACILIVPEKRRDTLPSFFKWLHDIFNFKQLLIEKILKVAYIFSTVTLIVYGFLTLLSSPAYAYYTTSLMTSSAISGLLTMILGPIILRLAYEFLMMIILLVKNVIEINNKLGNAPETPKKDTPDTRRPETSTSRPGSAPVRPQPQTQQIRKPVPPVQPVKPAEEAWVFCTACGTKFDKNKGNCPNCGKQSL